MIMADTKKMRRSISGKSKTLNSKSQKTLPSVGKSMKTITDKKSKEKLSSLAKGISHPVRVEILRMLAHKPPDCRCFCGKIVDALPLAQSSVSQHLKILKETGWITAEPLGTSMCYCLVDGILDHYKNLMDTVIIYTKNGA